jgi:hypothetical protein
MKYFLFCLLCFLSYSSAATVYRIHDNTNVITINGAKYRESISSNNKAQFITTSKKINTNHHVTKYNNHNLITKYNRWNIKPSYDWILLFDYNTTQTKLVHYAHNININNGKIVPQIVVFVNNNEKYRGSEPSLFTSFQEHNIYNIKVYIYNPSKEQISIKSHEGNGYMYNANAWVWYKQKKDNDNNMNININTKLPINIGINPRAYYI